MRTTWLWVAMAMWIGTMPAAARAEPAHGLGIALDEDDRRVGLLCGPAFGSATPFFALQAVESSQGRWFNRSWALAELFAGLAGSAYSTWLLHGAIEAEGGEPIPVASWTAGAALAMNLRLVTHGALSIALGDGDTDPLARSLVPSIAVSPLEGGALLSLRWTL